MTGSKSPNKTLVKPISESNIPIKPKDNQQTQKQNSTQTLKTNTPPQTKNTHKNQHTSQRLLH